MMTPEEKKIMDDLAVQNGQLREEVALLSQVIEKFKEYIFDVGGQIVESRITDSDYRTGDTYFRRYTIPTHDFIVKEPDEKKVLSFMSMIDNGILPPLDFSNKWKPRLTRDTLMENHYVDKCRRHE